MQRQNGIPQLKKKIATECVSWRWHGNLGDDMIFAAQEAMFGDMLHLEQYVPAPEAVLVGGGTFIPKAPEHPELVKLSQQLPTAFFGTGIGDPVFWGTKYIPEWFDIMGKARFIGVRGPLSRKRLESWGVPSHRIEVVGDPALYFAQKFGSRRRFQGRLAVNLGITYGNLYGFDEQQLERAIILAVRHLARIGWEITLVCAWQPDDVVLERIKTEAPVSSIRHWHENYATALESVETFDVVLSEKLHVGIVAACRGTPFVALNYRSKVMDFCRSIGWENYCVSTENLEPDRIVQLITMLGQARDEQADRLQQGVSRARERLLDAVPRTISALVGGL